MRSNRESNERLNHLNDNSVNTERNDSERDINWKQLAQRRETKRLNTRRQQLENFALRSGHQFTNEDNDWLFHMNDSFNKCDKSGRVLVNIGHPSNEPDIYLRPNISKGLKSYQIGGIRFLFDNLIESIQQFSKSGGFGCILSHSMGLGKTVQAVILVDILLKYTAAKHVLIIVPVNVLINWSNEFDKWVPKENRKFKIYSINRQKVIHRNRLILQWFEFGGVLIIGYEKYSLIIKNSDRLDPKKIKEFDPNKAEDMLEANNLKKALVDPGPQLVICDEGHRIKNDRTRIAELMKNINTNRRLILTGYPLQNNLKEFFCMIDFVRPDYLGSQSDFNDMFGKPILDGQLLDSGESEKQLSRERSAQLNHLLRGIIQRRNENVIKDILRPKSEFVLFCRLTDKQKELIKIFLISCMTDLNKNRLNVLKIFWVCSEICIHPDLIYNSVTNSQNNEEISDSNEELTPNHKEVDL